jgi:AhpD family alkylhydroperoxidase
VHREAGREAGRDADAPPPASASAAAGAPAVAGEKEKTVSHAEGCCESGSGTPDQAIGMFQNFMGTALQPGAVDMVSKELMAVALSLAVGCLPCARIHLRKSRAMGIGMPELEEAAALATAFAGCRALMMWNELKKEKG